MASWPMRIVGSSEKSTFSRCEICSGLQADDQQRLCRCNSYDNAQARTIIGLFKTEVINRLGPWKSKDQVEWEPCNRSIGSTRSARSNLLATSRQSKQRRSTNKPCKRSKSQIEIRNQKSPIKPGRFKAGKPSCSRKRFFNVS